MQFGTYFFNHAPLAVEDFARSIQPPEGEFDENWEDDSAYSTLMRNIWRESRAGYANMLRALDDFDLWDDYNEFCAKANYEFAKKDLDGFEIPYIDDRPPFEVFLEEAKTT